MTSLRFDRNANTAAETFYTGVHTHTTFNNISAPSLPLHILLCGHTRESRREWTKVYNLSSSLMSCRRFREAKCYISWLLENDSAAKAYRWGHDDVMSGYTLHYGPVSAHTHSSWAQTSGSDCFLPSNLILQLLKSTTFIKWILNFQHSFCSLWFEHQSWETNRTHGGFCKRNVYFHH